MSRIMAIDWGEKRIGIAVSDPLNITAQPLVVIENKGKKTWEELQELVKKYDVKEIAVGIPLQTSGEEGEKAKIVKSWISLAQENLKGVKFSGIDERFTTTQAQRLLHEGGIESRKQRKILDKVAAALILEEFLLKRSKS